MLVGGLPRAGFEGFRAHVPRLAYSIWLVTEACDYAEIVSLMHK
jgi:hypothetical protein